MKRTFVDTNVVLRYLVPEPGDHHPRAVELFRRVSLGLETVYLSDSVVLETVHVLATVYRLARNEISTALIGLFSLDSIELPSKREITEALSFWVSEPPLSFPDCLHLVLTKALGLSEIYTFDKKMNRYPGVERVEP